MTWTFWLVFGLIVGGLLAGDLGLFGRRRHAIALGEALAAVGLRIALALAFCAAIWVGWIGGYATEAARHRAGAEFLLGYVLELALSLDNVFVFALLFRYFQVPALLQPRVLFWGILGALVMRAALIFAGVALVRSFDWVLYLFAIVLIIGGIKMMRDDKEQTDPGRNPVVRGFRRLMPITADYRGDKFLVREDGRWMATPLAVVLVAIETTDLIFAVDSVPAVLAVTQDFLIVFTSNVFAILGLHSLYFALAAILRILRFLHYGLSAILIFIGVKMILHATPWAIGTAQSLVVVAALLAGSIAA
ncbi:MAG: TerC/Alx family metal homeostasis membrane protein, partial [Terrimicrobiaceae bacterium]|nr:TerC/Alx family metal homeostasis membrane protein [Terrimicrobiaceae bacterium]